MAQGELELTEKALRKNPKSYAAWFHRRWVVRHGHCSLDNELALIDKYASREAKGLLLGCMHCSVLKCATTLKT